VRLGSRLTRKVGLVAKLVWGVKLLAELRPGVLTETEVARIEHDEQAGLADLGLRLAETKRLTAALQAEIVPAQVARCASSVAVVRLAGAGWRARATIPLPSVLCSVMYRCASDACLSIPVRKRLR
jgi:hypothetical protein